MAPEGYSGGNAMEVFRLRWLKKGLIHHCHASNGPQGKFFFITMSPITVYEECLFSGSKDCCTDEKELVNFCRCH